MQRGATLIEVVVVTAMVGVVVAAGMGAISDQARRQRATDAARHALQPHQIARDRAVGARTCSETFLFPALGRGSPPSLPTGVPAIAQRKNPMIAVVQWAKCGFDNSVVRVDLVELEGDVTFSTYVGANGGRLVFAEDGAITSLLPSTSAAPSATLVCLTGRPDVGTGTGGLTGGSSGGSTSGHGGTGGTCTAPPPPPPPPSDVTFTVTTFFGTTENYRVFARVGATEAG
jgi:hypothetical protein